MENTEQIPDIFIKINKQEQLSSEKLYLNLDIVVLNLSNPVPNQHVIAEIGEEQKVISIAETGRADAVDLVYDFDSGKRDKLRLWVKDIEERVSVYEIVGSDYERTIEEGKEAELKMRIEKIKGESLDEKEQLEVNFTEIASSLTTQLNRQVKEHDKVALKEVCDFYQNLINNNSFAFIGHVKKSINSLSEEIFRLHAELKKIALEILSVRNLGKGDILTYSSDNLNNELGFNTVNEFKMALKTIPPCINDPHYKYPSIRDSGYINNSKVCELRSTLRNITAAQHYLKSIEEEIEQCIPQDCDFHKKLSDISQSCSIAEFPKKISEILTGYSKETIMKAYSFLYSKNFSSIDEVVEFEQNRFNKLILNIDTIKIQEKAEILSSCITDKNYSFAWTAFGKLLKAIKEDKKLAETINIDKFESDWGEYLSIFKERWGLK